MVKMYRERIPDKDLEKLINKGAALKEEIDEYQKKWKNLNLRIPVVMLMEINEVLKSEVGISRTGWILQAIQKALKTHDN